MVISETAKRAIAYYGGMQVWNESQSILAEVSTAGLAFLLKRRPVFKHAQIQMDINSPIVKISPIGKNPCLSGVLNHDDVQLRNQYGDIEAERSSARRKFPLGRRLLYWDDLDMTYFACYAFWNYFTLPKLLLNANIQWTEMEPGTLMAIFPTSIPTHNTKQVFHFEENGKLLQHNYTADVISKFATAANVVTEHQTQNGINFPSRRIVSPRLNSGKPLGKPVLIDITVHNYAISKTPFVF